MSHSHHKCNCKLLEGFVQSGIDWSKSPLSNMKVQLFFSNPCGESISIQESVSNMQGYFSMYVPDYHRLEKQNGLFYIIATNRFDSHKKLMLVMGSQLLNDTYIIHERSTISAIYCSAQFYNKYQEIITCKSNPLVLKIIGKMNLNLIQYNGKLSEVIRFSPNGDETNSMRLLNSLSNLFYAILQNYSLYQSLLTYTTLNGYVPRNTIDIFLHIALNPGNFVNEIYEMTLQVKKFAYSFYLTDQQKPDCLCIAVKVNDTGNDEYLFGGPANCIFDKNGNAWITNNVVQGTIDSSNFDVVLDCSGKPSKQDCHNPPSLLFGGGILGSAFGIAFDRQDNVLLSTFGWGTVLPSAGAIAAFSPNGIPLSSSNGITKDTYRVQGITVDHAGNIWLSSNGNDRVVVYIRGNPSQSVFYQFPEGSKPFDLQLDHLDDDVVLSLGGSDSVVPSIVKLRLVNSQIQIVFQTVVGQKLIGLAINSKDDIFVASSLDSSVYKLNRFGTIIKQITDSSINTPWSVTVDGADNVWVANFDFLLAKTFGISKMDSDGNILCPSTGFNILTGGSQVLLHNGLPLYYPLPEKSFDPLQRLTAARVDAAGNLWAINNWKPPFFQDVYLNPGGDGIVIFLGLATPFS